MNHPTVRVIAPSRLHFGMLSFGQSGLPRYGGVGAMIDSPRLEIELVAADRLEAHGPDAQRAEELARLAIAHWQLAAGCRIAIVAAPPPHVGFGTGTQMALAIAAGLLALHGRPTSDAVELARPMGRAGRSAVGTYGFSMGGLIVEAGRTDEQQISPLISRMELPGAWRWVLACPTREQGLSGEAERTAFERLPPVPLETTAQLCREVLMGMLPAAQQCRFEEFSQSLYRYSLIAGECFAAVQGGPFARPDIVKVFQSLGVQGVGQSSWGPTVFAILPNEDAAQSLVQRLRNCGQAAGLNLSVARPDNRGAQVIRGA